MRCLIIVLFFLLSTGFAAPEVRQGIPAVRPPSHDSLTVTPRHFDRKALAEWGRQREFQYASSAPVGESWWDRFWRWFWGLVNQVSPKANKSVLTYVFLAACVAILVFLVTKLPGMELVNLLTGRPKSVALPYDESLENIHEISFDAEIERAVTSHNYRLAVRLLYLKCLKQLSDAGTIHWQPEKTNAAYLAEIASGEPYEEFSALTSQFEYIWYGNFSLNGRAFDRIQQSFFDFMGRPDERS